MVNFDDVTGENTITHNPNWPQIPDHPLQNTNNNLRLWIRKNECFFLISH